MQKYFVITALLVSAALAWAQAPGTATLLIGNAAYDAFTGALTNPRFLQGPPVKLTAAAASDTNLYVQSGFSLSQLLQCQVKLRRNN
jgi:hypothetical protein